MVNGTGQRSCGWEKRKLPSQAVDSLICPALLQLGLKSAPEVPEEALSPAEAGGGSFQGQSKAGDLLVSGDCC